MFDRRLRALAAAVRRDPRDLDAWREVAGVARKTGRVPAFVDAARHGAALLALWAEMPARRDLGTLVLGALGLEAVAEPGPPPGFWVESGRGARAEDGWYDRDSGLPLLARVAGTRLELCLVPGGAVTSTDRRAWERGGVAREVAVPRLWVGRYPVRVSDYADFLARAGGGATPDHWVEQLRRPGRPVVWIDWDQAAAYARAVGGRLLTEAEWLHAALGGRAYPWDAGPGAPAAGDAPAALRRPGDPFRAPEDWGEHLRDVAAHPGGRGPFGLFDAVGNAWEWSADWGPPMVDRWLGREAPDPNRGRPRVCLGRSWADRIRGPRERAWHYGTAAPVLRAPNRGLRVARPVDPPGDAATPGPGG